MIMMVVGWDVIMLAVILASSQVKLNLDIFGYFWIFLVNNLGPTLLLIKECKDSVFFFK